ncbi:MAG: M42 family metallopeptidase [Anaerolineae bacterium]|nr:M42 family metallopeptidase [Anaerolineae bacterium]
METYALLKSLSEAPGPAGYEDSIRQITTGLWQPLVDELRTDAMGNLIAVQRGTSSNPAECRVLMAAAHMDEIGLIVTGIEGEFLHVQQLGGMDRRILLGLEVRVYGRRELPGVIGSRPPHVLPQAERDKVLPWHELFIDVGLSQDEVKNLVRVGDYVTFTQPLNELKNGQAAGKALDNRASLAALTLALEALQHRKHAWDFYAVATVQEEVGVKGAITSAYGVDPDMAIALDVTFAKQFNDSDPGVFELGKGPTIGLGPNLHPWVVARLKAVADAEEIPNQIEPLPGSSGTDAWGIQVAREGIPSGLISIPVRYMHQPVETVALKDVERAGRLLTAFAASLSADDLPKWDDETQKGGNA